ncbi:MAG: response regulator [Aquisalimonadaceae bacterium]
MTETLAYIVDDDPAIRDSIARLLETENIQTRTYPSAMSFLSDYAPGGAECLIVDVRMPGISGLELQDRLNQHGYTLPVIVMTGHADVPMAVRAMKAGALDFIEKPLNEHHLLRGVRAALQAATQAHEQRLREQTMTARMILLTDREREVLRRVVAGRYNKVIAAELRVSVSTVETHRRNIMRKLRANSLYELVRIADAHWDRRRR